MRHLTAIFIAIVAASSLGAGALPQGSNLEVRLLARVGSRVSHLGDPVEATVITPVVANGTLLLPAGVTVSGSVEHIDRLGLGLRHTTARIDLHFTHVHLAGGGVFPIDARVSSVETARESVSSNGAIIGINPTANFSTGISALFTLMSLGERELRIPMIGFKFLAARSPDAEIYFPAGTDMVLEMAAHADLPSFANSESAVPLLNPAQIENVQNTLASLPAQQTNRSRNRPSDLINILILGSQDQVERTFRAAGWSGAERHGIMALYRMFHCAVERKGYSMAPMTTLTLNGNAPDAAFQKSLDTFAKRHHIRIWRDTLSGAWLGAATEDVSYKFVRGHLTHATDRRIDNERAKVVNDLAFTGCIDKGALMPRASLTPAQDDGTTIVTDGDIAVLQLNDCISPRALPADPVKPRPVRAIRAAIVIGVDIARSNPVSVTYALTKSLLDNSKIRVDERLQAGRSFTRPSALASAETVVAGGAIAGR